MRHTVTQRQQNEVELIMDMELIMISLNKLVDIVGYGALHNS